MFMTSCVCLCDFSPPSRSCAASSAPRAASSGPPRAAAPSGPSSAVPGPDLPISAHNSEERQTLVSPCETTPRHTSGHWQALTGMVVHDEERIKVVQQGFIIRQAASIKPPCEAQRIPMQSGERERSRSPRWPAACAAACAGLWRAVSPEPALAGTPRLLQLPSAVP